MAEKTTGSLPLWPITRKLKAKGLHPGEDASEHDSTLYDCWSAHGGVKRLREEFSLALTEAEARLASGELGPLGLAKEKKRIESEFREKLEAYRPALDRARKEADRLRGELTARPKTKSADIDEAIEKAFQRHDTIADFKALPPDQRRAALRVALEKRDHNFLSILLNEPALLDDENARRIQIELMKGGDRRKFARLEELVGIHNYDGQPDVLTGAVPVLAYSLDSTVDWFAQQAGIDTRARAAEEAVAKASGEDRELFTAKAAKASEASKAAKAAKATDKKEATDRAAKATDAADKLSSAEICEALGTMEDRPWPEYGRARRPISASQIARLLRPFGVTPDSVRIGDATPKGYKLEQFTDAFSRYLAVLADPDRNTATSLLSVGETALFQSATPDQCCGSKNDGKPNEENECCGVAAEKPKNRDSQKKKVRVKF